jgi:hypothetical protein
VRIFLLELVGNSESMKRERDERDERETRESSREFKRVQERERERDESIRSC